VRLRIKNTSAARLRHPPHVRDLHHPSRALTLAVLALIPFTASALGATPPDYIDSPPTATGDSIDGRPPKPHRQQGTSPAPANEAPAPTATAADPGAEPAEGPGPKPMKADRNSRGHQEAKTNGGQQSPASEDDDDSSPLLPVLGAILALGAISLAVVTIRRRRDRQGLAARSADGDDGGKSK
jgi:type IV secretory pathway VirB10-like protein